MASCVTLRNKCHENKIKYGMSIITHCEVVATIAFDLDGIRCCLSRGSLLLYFCHGNEQRTGCHGLHRTSTTAMPSDIHRRRDKEPDLLRLSDDEDDSDEEDEEYLQALEEWEESVKQLQMLVSVVLLPWFGKWAGRKWAHWLHIRYARFGFGRMFFLGAR